MNAVKGIVLQLQEKGIQYLQREFQLKLKSGRNQVPHRGHEFLERIDLCVFQLHLIHEGREIVYLLKLFKVPAYPARRTCWRSEWWPTASAAGRTVGTWHFRLRASHSREFQNIFQKYSEKLIPILAKNINDKNKKLSLNAILALSMHCS